MANRGSTSFRLVRVGQTEAEALARDTDASILFAIGHEAAEWDRGAGRPLSTSSIVGLDAAWLVLELERRGLSGREAEDTVRQLLGVSRSHVQQYKPEARSSVAAADASRLASGIAARWWPTIEPRLPTLAPRPRQAVGDLYYGRPTAALPAGNRRKRRR